MSESDRFGGWSIDQAVFGWILSNLRVGSHILELGSGWSTGELARYYKMTSVEEHDTWVGKYDSTYIHAHSLNGWYDRKTLEAELPKVQYDLLLIDGPHQYHRNQLMKNLDLFDWSKSVIIDDCQESAFMDMAAELANHYCKRPMQIINGLGYDYHEAKKAVGIK